MQMLLQLLLGFAFLVILVLLFGPREPVDGEITFEPGMLGDNLDAYLAASEAVFDDIIPGTEKRIVWAGEPGARTDTVILYLHGFLATSEEIRPVPDQVAANLGANLYFARFTGHGRTGEAMAEARAVDWRNDLAEAMAIGARLGDRIILIGTSTGGTLATLAAADPLMNAGVDGVILVAPNFKVNNPLAFVPDLPFARFYIEILGGAERQWEGVDAEHNFYWTTRYPTRAVIPMSATVRAANALDPRTIDVPVLIIFDPGDEVVRHDRTVEIAEAWGGPTYVVRVSVGPNDDPARHVIAGDIRSPDMTAPTVATMTRWINAL